jgi:Domain of unknown function (DUF4157)/Putative RNase-like toxin, toxin_1
MGSALTTTAGPTAARQPSAVPVAERADAAEAPLAARRLLRLQQLAGNRAVSHAVRLSLPMGAPDGDGERNADAVADGGGLSRPRIGATRLVRVPDSIIDVFRRSDGRPVDPATRARMEPRLKTGLGDVRVHTSALAAASARDLGAAAYTIGDDIVFAAGRFEPATHRGSRLLAHELAHVAQQRANGQAGVQLQPADKPQEEPGGAVETAAAAARRRLTVGVVSAILRSAGIPAVGPPLVTSAAYGFSEELVRQLVEQRKGIILLANLARFGPGDIVEVHKGFVIGLAEGIVSPVTDLFGLAVFGERVNVLMRRLLVSVFNSTGQIGAEVDALLAEVRKLGDGVDKAWEDAKKDPVRTIVAIVSLPDALSTFAQDQAYKLGKAGGAQIVKSLESPWAEEKPHEPEPSFLETPLAWVESKAQRLEARIIATPWAKIGSKLGYATGWVAIQAILLAFTEGIGNAIEQAAAALGRFANTLAKFSRGLSHVLGRGAEMVRAIGSGIAAVETAIAMLIGKALKPLEKLLAPLLKPLEAVFTRLRTLLRKLFGVAEKESAQIVETTAAKAAGAVEKKAAGAAEETATGAEKVLASEPVAGGHRVEITPVGVTLCSGPPCPLLRVEYAKELAANPRLAEELDVLDALRKTDPVAAARKAAQLQESLSLLRAHTQLFTELPSHATLADRSRLAELLQDAEDAGFHLSQAQLAEITKRLGKTRSSGELDQALGALERSLGMAPSPKEELAAAVRQAGGDTSVPLPPPATTLIRGQPGVATGGENLPLIVEGRWFQDLPTRPGVTAPIPRQVADRMRGLRFDNWADFRSTFWKTVANDPVLRQGWRPQNLALMQQGRAPFVKALEAVGGRANAVYQINHKLALEHGGPLFDFDNLEIVSPLFHVDIGM